MLCLSVYLFICLSVYQEIFVPPEKRIALPTQEMGTTIVKDYPTPAAKWPGFARPFS